MSISDSSEADPRSQILSVALFSVTWSSQGHCGVSRSVSGALCKKGDERKEGRTRMLSGLISACMTVHFFMSERARNI
jgi:hypothetical protein